MKYIGEVGYNPELEHLRFIAPAVLAALIAGGVSIVNSVGNYHTQKANQESQNEYNSPVEQMMRLKEAGMNPNMAMGNLNNGNMAPASYSNMMPLPENLGEIAQTASEQYSTQQVNDSTIIKNEAEAAVATEQARGIKIDNDIKDKELGNWQERFDTEMAEKRSAIAKNAFEVSKLNKEIDRIDEEIKNLKEQRDTIIAERGLIEYEKTLKSAQARRENAIAQKEEATNSVGLAPGDPWYNYYKAVQEHGAESDEAESAYETAYEAEKAKNNAAQEGRNESDAKYHFGMYYENQLIQNVKDAENAMGKIKNGTSMLVNNLNRNGNDYKIEYTSRGHMKLKGTHKSEAKMSYAERKWLEELNQKIDDYNGLNKLKRREREKGIVKDNGIGSVVPFNPFK